MKSSMTELERALEALGAMAECAGTSEFPTRKDVLLDTVSLDALETVQQVKGAA